MSTTHHPVFLRRALTADVILSGACAMLLVTAASMLEPLLGLDAAFLRMAGASLIPFTALLVYLLKRYSLSANAVWFVILCNALWAIDSIALLFTGWVNPTTIGQVFVVFQAAVVAAFAEVQFVALRGSGLISHASPAKSVPTP